MSNYDYWSEDLNATEDILEHHGILGQKWGVRRYQNEDKSLTSAGRKRYNPLQSVTNRIQRGSAIFAARKAQLAKKAYKADPTDKNKKKYDDAKKEATKRTAKKVTAVVIGAAAGIGIAALSTKMGRMPSLAGGGKRLNGIMELPSVANRYVNTIAE